MPPWAAETAGPVGVSAGNPDETSDLAIPCMYASRSLVGDNVFQGNKHFKVKVKGAAKNNVCTL